MSALIDSLAGFFIQHPIAQVIAAYLGRLLGGLFALVLISGCLFLAFGNQKAFFYHEGSWAGKCWKTGWMLQIAGVADLSYRFLSGNKEFSSFEAVFDCIPLVLLLFAQQYGYKYHKDVQVARRNAKTNNKQ